MGHIDNNIHELQLLALIHIANPDPNPVY